MGATILWVICALFCWITYHRIFRVVYFDFTRGCIGEIIWAALGGTILMFLFTSYWYIAVAIVVITLIICGGAGKSS